MKKFAAIILATASLASLAAVVPAAAAQRHQERSARSSVEGQGYYEGSREMRVDSRDRASSPYAGGV